MNLNDVFESIVNNTDIHNLLTDVLNNNPLRPHPYKQLVEFQVKAYEDAGLDIANQGFQIGEPWNGDIEKARILFLSSNPAFTVNENFPRYFAQDKIFAMPYQKGTPLSLSDIRKFFTERFQNACVAGGRFHVGTIDPDGEKCCLEVPYWGCIRNNVETLMPGNPPAIRDKAYFRGLMSRAVSMEVVPFKSSTSTGVVAATLQTCWGNFTQHILPLAAAPIFVLVGKMPKKAFLENALSGNARSKAEQAFSQRKIYLYKDTGGTDRAVVWVEFNSGKFSRFETYFSKPTLDKLRGIMNAPLKN